MKYPRTAAVSIGLLFSLAVDSETSISRMNPECSQIEITGQFTSRPIVNEAFVSFVVDYDPPVDTCHINMVV